MSNFKFTEVFFGTLYDGSKVSLYTISNGKMSFSATNYGCTITSILIPSSDGKMIDCVLGCSTLEGYSGFNKVVEKGEYKILRPLIYLTKDDIYKYAYINKDIDKNPCQYVSLPSNLSKSRRKIPTEEETEHPAVPATKS